VDRPGLDPGTLGVFPECPGTSLNVQIRWPAGVECPPTSADVLSRLNSWLDSWLDQESFEGIGIIQFRGVDGEVFDLRLGGRVGNSPDHLVAKKPVAIHVQVHSRSLVNEVQIWRSTPSVSWPVSSPTGSPPPWTWSPRASMIFARGALSNPGRITLRYSSSQPSLRCARSSISVSLASQWRSPHP
jgi:hypothetical protein